MAELKTAQVNLRLEPSLKAAAEQAAKADRRSLTSYIEKLIEDDLRAKDRQRNSSYWPSGSTLWPHQSMTECLSDEPLRQIPAKLLRRAEKR